MEKCNNSRVVRTPNGRYHPSTRIQDGTERGPECRTLSEALRWCEETEKIMNGLSIEKRDIPVFRERLGSPDVELLDSLVVALAQIDQLRSEIDLSESIREQELLEQSALRNALKIAMQALQGIAVFDHMGGPECCPNAPVYECGCYDKTQWDLARDALTRIKDLR